MSGASDWGGIGGTHLMAAIIVSGMPHKPNPPTKTVEPGVISAAACCVWTAWCVGGQF
jgi:hypothetical protein